MKTRHLKRSIVAVLCAVAMVFGSLGSYAQVLVAEATEGTYQEYSFRDFGIAPGTMPADTIGTVDGLKSLDGVAISGKVKFGSSWLMLGHESAENSEWSGIQMFVDEDGKSLKVAGTLFAEQALSKFSVGTGAGSSASETEEGYVKIDFDGTSTWCDIGLSPIAANSEIHVFMKNDSDYPRYVQMNWTTATKMLKDGVDITDVSEGATKIPANSGWVEVVYPVTTGSQFNCISRGTEGDASVGSLLLKGYYVDERTEQQYGFDPSDGQIGSEEAGVDFANDYADMRFIFDYIDTGVDMGVYVNGNFIKTIRFGTSRDGSYNMKEILGKYVMASGGFSSVATYQELTFADFGIGEGTVSSDFIGTNEDITSLNGVAVSGKVKFGSSWLMLGHESTTSGEWTGIQMLVNEDNTGLKVSGHVYGEVPATSEGQLQITSTTGSSYSVTEEGYIKVDFDGTEKWCDVNFNTITSDSEIHVFLNNASDYARYVQMNWTGASKVLKDGVDITEEVVLPAGDGQYNTKIPANSGWLEVVYPLTSGTQFNCISRDTADGMSTGSLYIKGYKKEVSEKASLTQLPVTSTAGSTFSVTEEGYIKVAYDGTGQWCDTGFSSITAGKEIHLIMKNDSDNARIVSLDWNGASKVLNEEGEDITSSIVSENNTVIPANSGWLEVVYPVTTATHINAISLAGATGGEGTNSVGNLYIQGYTVDATYYQPVEKAVYAFAPSDALISSEETGVDFSNDFVNLRFTFDYTDTGIDMGVHVNNSFIKTISFGASSDGLQNIKNCLGKYIMVTGGMEVAKPDSQAVTDDIYCNLDLGAYTITEADTVTIDGETYAKGDSYSKVGVHTLSYSMFNKEYTRKLVVYRYGDLNDDSSVTLRDLMRMEKYLSAEVELALTESSLKGADMSCDEIVDEVDSNLLREYLVVGEGTLVLSPTEGSTVALPSEAAAALITDYQVGKADGIKTGEDIYFRTPVVFNWIPAVKASEYTLLLATKQDLSDAVTYKVTAPMLSVDNLLSDTIYYWKATAENMDTGLCSFRTADTIRSLTVEGVSNVRDGGGWATLDGKTVKQGMFYRGGKLEGITAEGLAAMKALGIKTDLDLRNNTETSASNSPLGEEVTYVNYSGPYYWTGSDGAGINTEAYREALVNEIRTFADEDNYPIYVHCSLGRDRTGTLCFLINALCGVDEEELCLDYEFSFLSETGNLDGQTSAYMMSTFKNMYDNVKAYAPDGTMAEATENFMLSIGVTQEEINAIRNILLED